MNPARDDEHEVHVEPDPEHPGAWRITVDGCLASRHPSREEALENSLTVLEELREEAPARLTIDAAAVEGHAAEELPEGGPGEDGGGDAP